MISMFYWWSWIGQFFDTLGFCISICWTNFHYSYLSLSEKIENICHFRKILQLAKPGISNDFSLRALNAEPLALSLGSKHVSIVSFGTSIDELCTFTIFIAPHWPHGATRASDQWPFAGDFVRHTCRVAVSPLTSDVFPVGVCLGWAPKPVLRVRSFRTPIVGHAPERKWKFACSTNLSAINSQTSTRFVWWITNKGDRTWTTHPNIFSTFIKQRPDKGWSGASASYQ